MLTFPVNTLSINFAQLIVNLENNIMELDFASKFNNMTLIMTSNDIIVSIKLCPDVGNK